MTVTPESDASAPVYWGPRTLAAIQNFDARGVRLSAAPQLVISLATVRAAVARVERDRGRLSAAARAAIGDACAEVVQGRWHDQFVVDIGHGGSPRQVAANADEVLAARASQLGAEVDPADLGAEAIDVHATSLRLAVVLAAQGLLSVLSALQQELCRRASALSDRVVAEQPVLQALRQRLGGYASDLADHGAAVERGLAELREVVYDGPETDVAATVAAELTVSTGEVFVARAAGRRADPLLALSRLLKPLAVRLAQVWSGLSTLAASAGLPVPGRSRTETVNRIALDVIGTALQDEVRAAEGPADQALTVSLLGSLGRLGEASRAILDWCVDDAPYRVLAA